MQQKEAFVARARTLHSARFRQYPAMRTMDAFRSGFRGSFLTAMERSFPIALFLRYDCTYGTIHIAHSSSVLPQFHTGFEGKATLTTCPGSIITYVGWSSRR